MAIPIKKGRQAAPVREFIYGPPKVGKTTAACDSDDPIVLSGEAGDGQFDVSRIVFDEKSGRTWPTSWDEVTKMLHQLADSKDLLGKTLVVDGLGALEKLCGSAVCAKNKWDNLGTPGYGKGESALLKEMEQFLRLIERCWANGYAVIFVSHSKIGKVKNPAGEEYTRFVPALADINTGDVAGLFVGWVDVVLFAQVEVDVAKTDKRAIGIGTGRHVFRTKSGAAWVGGCRYENVPETMDLDHRELHRLIAEGQSPKLMLQKVTSLLAKLPADNDGAKAVAGWVASPGTKDVKLLCRAAARLQSEIETHGEVAQAA